MAVKRISQDFKQAGLRVGAVKGSPEAIIRTFGNSGTPEVIYKLPKANKTGVAVSNSYTKADGKRTANTKAIRIGNYANTQDLIANMGDVEAAVADGQKVTAQVVTNGRTIKVLPQDAVKKPMSLSLLEPDQIKQLQKGKSITVNWQGEDVKVDAKKVANYVKNDFDKKGEFIGKTEHSIKGDTITPVTGFDRSKGSLTEMTAKNGKAVNQRSYTPEIGLEELRAVNDIYRQVRADIAAGVYDGMVKGGNMADLRHYVKVKANAYRKLSQRKEFTQNLGLLYRDAVENEIRKAGKTRKNINGREVGGESRAEQVARRAGRLAGIKAAKEGKSIDAVIDAEGTKLLKGRFAQASDMEIMRQQAKKAYDAELTNITKNVNNIDAGKGKKRAAENALIAESKAQVAAGRNAYTVQQAFTKLRKEKGITVGKHPSNKAKSQARPKKTLRIKPR